MSALNRTSHSINLLPGQKLDDSSGGQVIKWLLSTFRIIVVVVQVIVILAFAARVFVDARLSSLNHEVEDKYALVKSYQNIEDTFLVKKLKLETFQALQSPDNSYLSLVTQVSQTIPSNVQIISIVKNGSNLTIKARTDNEASMYTFASGLEDAESIQNAQVVEIRQDSTTNNISEFTIDADIPSVDSKTS